jgi:hypothetical protein
VGLLKPVNPGVAGKIRKHLESLDEEKGAFLDVTAPPLPVKDIKHITRIPTLLV